MDSWCILLVHTVTVNRDGPLNWSTAGESLMLRAFALPFCVLILCSCCLQNGCSADELRLISAERIWDHAAHNAFTDLVRFDDNWFCVFREGQGHVSPDGSLRVITSTDGSAWTSAALISSPDSDLRDAKITVTPDGRLMLAGAEAMHDQQEYKHQSLVWFSSNGKDWSDAVDVGDRDNWLWRISWQGKHAYGFGYGTRQRGLSFFRGDATGKFHKVIDRVDVGGTYPNETSIIFGSGDEPTALCLLRQDGDPKLGFLGSSRPPYTDWSWKPLDRRIGGPHMIRIPDGRLIAAVRLYDGGARTSLCWLDAEQATLTEALRLPSGGDTSYAGLVWHAQQLWVSYYSSHEGKTCIYLARAEIVR